METKITIGASMSLFGVINKILFEVVDNEVKEREIPFNLRYKLQKNQALTEKDYLFFNAERNKIIDEVGVFDKEIQTKKIPDEKMDEFKEKLTTVLMMQVSHEFSKLKPEDLDVIDITNVTTDEMNIFILALVDDEAFLNTIQNRMEE